VRAPVRLHRPTLVGRVRSDPALLLLIGLVVAVATALTAAVSPFTERTADRAMAATVRDAGARGAVVATFPREEEDLRGQARDPLAVTKFRQDSDYAQFKLPRRLASVVRPGVASLTTPPLQLLDDGPGRYLRLAYLDTPEGAPSVTYVAGGPPPASVGADQASIAPEGARPWPVQVALSEAVATALGLAPGDRLPAQDAQHRQVEIRISGVFVADRPDDDAWQASSQLLNPVQGVTQGGQRISAAALVSPEALPDLRLAVPLDDLTHRVVFTPRAERVRWDGSAELARSVVSLKASAGLARGRISWDSLLDGVLADGRAQVAAAQGQARVLLLGLLVGVLLVLALAAQLLVRRRAAPVALARERGAGLLDIAAELLVESVVVAGAGAVAGLAAVRLLAGGAGWTWSLPVVLAACLASPVLGVLLAARSTDIRRVPANRGARRTAARARRARRYLVELAVVAAAVVTLAALHQRGIAERDGGAGDLTAASAPTWWALAGAVVVLRVFPVLARLLLNRARRSTGVVRFFVAARLAQTGARALPLLVLVVTVAQLTLGLALTATEQRGQEQGALLAVGGDARLTTTAAPSVRELAGSVSSAPGVEAAVAARVADGVRASSRESAASVRLVVVDAADYERLLRASSLPDAPALSRLGAGEGSPVPALLLGGEPGLSTDLVVRWDDVPVPLEVVGVAPRVEAATDPVVVVDAGAFAATGAIADPDTVWAVGPGAARAVGEASGAGDDVVLRSAVLDARRDAPLAAGLVHLSVAFTALLVLLAVLAIALAAAVEAPDRRQAFGRLRSLGLGRAELGRVLAGELLGPVVLATLAGLALGVGGALTTLGSLSLERITGQTTAPELAVPWWTLLVVPVLAVAAVVTARVEAARLRRTALAQLLRAGDQRQ